MSFAPIRRRCQAGMTAIGPSATTRPTTRDPSGRSSVVAVRRPWPTTAPSTSATSDSLGS
jgi:hypothetical protein